MKNINHLFTLILLGLFALACSKDNSDEMPEPIEVPDEPVSFMDTASLESVVLNLFDYVPTWEELERFTNEAQRLPIPAFEKRALSWYGLGDDTGPFNSSEDWMPQVLAYNDNLIQEFGANMSTALMAGLPPFVNNDGSELTYPLPLDVLDEKLRTTTTLFLYEKSLGLPVTLVNFYPPNQETERFATKAEFYTWFEEKFLPEKEAEARAAEIMKAEKYMPWPLEFELFITDVGGIYDDGFLANSSPEEVLAFAEEVKTRILNTVKAQYNGIVVAHLYHNYQVRPEASYWDEMSYAGFDEIYFAIFPPYNVDFTEDYLNAQLPHYFKILENSGNLPWNASEISVFEWYVEAGQMEAYEKDMYQITFETLAASAVPPKGIAPASGYAKTQAARDYIRDYFAQR